MKTEYVSHNFTLIILKFVFYSFSNDGSKSAPKPRNIPPQVPDSEGSESGSQISSSLDVWGDDPVIQEKVRYLYYWRNRNSVS